MLNAGTDAYNVTGDGLVWQLDSVNPIIGDALTIYFSETQKAGSSVSVRVWYNTSAEAQAFSWMEPSQTAGGVLPYFYTQCEDINCRTVAPL
jgi:leukotriene-A4 hydrolase